MMKTLNRFQIIGRLTRDPEVKTNDNGTIIGTISLAQTNSRKKGDGTYEDTPVYHQVTVFGSTATFAEKYIKKGAQVFVEGEFIPYSYEQEDGVKKYGVKFTAQNLQALGSRSESTEPATDEMPEFPADGKATSAKDKPKPAAKKKAPPVEEINIEDIPF